MEREIVLHGTTIKYWEYHPNQKPTIIFWHGFRGSHRGLVDVAERLSNYRIIMPDLPGWGESGTLTTTHTFPHYISFLRDFIRALQLDRYILAGHSFGASLALVFASQCPEGIERLLLMAPVVNAGSFTSRLGELYYSVGAKMPAPLRKKWITSAALNRVSTELITVTTNLSQRRQLVKDEQSNVAYIKDWVEIETFQSFYEVDFWQSMKSLRMPTALISATRDRMTSMPTSRRMAAAIPGCEFVVLNGAGHFAPIEEPDSVAAAMNNIIRGHA